MLRDLVTSVRENLLLILICVALQLVLGIVLSRTYLLVNNTLHNGGTWIPSKIQLEKGVQGAYSFFLGRQALTKGRLNLGAWFGFQEVLYKDALHVDDFDFDFWLEPNAYLSVIFNKSEEGFSGVRFSVNNRFESTYFVASDVGGFLERKRLGRLGMEPRRWHHARLRFDTGAFSIFLDDEEIGSFREEIGHEQGVGFRGGFHDALVDNVVIRQNRRVVLHESFSNRKNASRITAFFLIPVVALNALVFLLVRFALGATGKNAGFYLVMLNMVLIVIGGLVFGYQYLTGSYYPRLDENLEKREQYWQNASAAAVIKDIRKRYGRTAAENTRRVLFMGTSQTWGAGASEQAATFVEVLEKKLNENATRGIRLECMNTGISGLKSFQLLKLYRREWIEFEPRVIVAIVGNNDRRMDRLQSSLEKMIELSAEAGIQPVLVLEANSAERGNRFLSAKHRVMRRVGRSYGVPVIDMHAYLGSRYDDGFLWWDYVHLTDFGQQLMAEKLYEELAPIVGEL
jgi:lysophospholipase L1-like esterase